MRASSRLKHLVRSPRLLYDILARGRYDYSFDLLPLRVRGMPLKKRVNLTAAGLNLLHRRSRPWAWPIHLKVELVNYCNLRCPVCPVGTKLLKRPRRAMDLGLFKQLMQEVGPYLLRISLHGWGESLLYPHIADAVSICREHGVFSVISTNGQNLTRSRVLDDLIRQPPTYLTVALDGLTQQTHSQYRVGARLETALEGVRRLAQMKRERHQDLPLLHMRFIAMKHNEHELPEAERFARANGFDILSVGTLNIRDMDERPHTQKVPTARGLCAYDYAGGRRVIRHDYVCQRPFLFPTVLADGTVVACEYDFNAQQPCGRIGVDGTFGDIWFGRRAAALRRLLRTGRETFSFCRNCPFADRSTDTGNLSVSLLRDQTAQPVQKGHPG